METPTNPTTKTTIHTWNGSDLDKVTGYIVEETTDTVIVATNEARTMRHRIPTSMIVGRS